MTEELTQLGLVEESEIALDDAALTLAALDHPDVDLEPYRDLLAAIAHRVGSVADATAAPREHAAALARVLGGEFGFAGDAETYDDPANADLIRVLERRRGLPVSLSILYVAAARHAGWVAAPLDVPGHVLVLVGADASPVVIDPFRGGRMVDHDTLAAMLPPVADADGQAVRHVATMHNRAVLVRLLLNQATRAEAAGQGKRALTLYRRMTVIAPAYPHAWWEAARLRLIDGDVDGARRSLGTILEITREPALRGRVSQMLASLANHHG